MYRNTLKSEKRQIQGLRHYDRIGDKYMCPLSLLVGQSARHVKLKQHTSRQLAIIDYYHYLNPYIILAAPRTNIKGTEDKPELCQPPRGSSPSAATSNNYLRWTLWRNKRT
jgi:hypothetical protein